jgi:DDE superfamily endonuclease
MGKLDAPDNITPIFLPSRAPELNPVENVWQYLRQNWLSNTVFEKLRRDRRRRMRRLAKAHRSTRNHHLHWNPRLGSPRSAAMTLGIRRSFDAGGKGGFSTSFAVRSRFILALSGKRWASVFAVNESERECTKCDRRRQENSLESAAYQHICARM